MAYPYNYYPGYVPYNYQQQMMQTPQQIPQYSQQMTQPQTAQPQQTNMIWVQSIMEAQAYPVGPNNAVQLWDTNGKTVYVKQADASGKPAMRIYDLVERAETASAEASAQDDKKVIYATKDDLAAVIGAVKGISGDIEQMKGDLYGVAGRKKAVKKQEDEE